MKRRDLLTLRGGVAIALAAGCACLLAGCTPTAEQFMPRYTDGGPTPLAFVVCHGYGCDLKTRVTLSAEEWRAVRARFSPAAGDAAAERAQIAQAIAVLESLVGIRTGTNAHQRRDFRNTGDETQMDCIDQTSNTWTYLTLMQDDGLLAHHRVGKPIYRGGLLTFDLSNTAVVVETESGASFALDATMVDAGVPPPVEPVQQWMAEVEPLWSARPYPP